MSESLGPAGMEKAWQYCTSCHRPSRVRLGWAWVCMACDYGWAIIDIRNGSGKS